VYTWLYASLLYYRYHGGYVASLLHYLGTMVGIPSSLLYYTLYTPGYTTVLHPSYVLLVRYRVSDREAERRPWALP